MVIDGNHQPDNVRVARLPVRAEHIAACCSNLSFHELQHLRNSGLVRLPDELLRASTRNSPQHRRALRDREGEVILCNYFARLLPDFPRAIAATVPANALGVSEGTSLRVRAATR